MSDTAGIPGDMRTTVEAWIAGDPDPVTVAEAQALLAAGDEAALQERFGARLAFGTAGLRGALGCGPNRMNRVVVRQSAAGLGRRLLAGDPGVGGRGVVIGFDARHNSDVFASDTAQVLAAMGIRALLFPHVVPTPVLAYAVRRLGAGGGVQVTASHNPPADNGYKVYWGDGAQIVSPIDQEISALIDEIAGAGTPVLLAGAGDPLVEIVEQSVIDGYVDGVHDLDPRVSTTPARNALRIVYTAMHGVGADTMERVFEEAGFTDMHPVVEQRHPDPDFPTVSFPNPEEPGALDLSFALARRVGAHLVVANDPDADRLAIGIPAPELAQGWRMLRGDEVGWLLADHLLRSGAADPDRLVLTTIVSSSLLSVMAARYGVQYRETLTGFKWLSHAAMDEPSLRPVLAYEEALGYCVGSHVRDKDGISAALVFADLAASLHGDGSSVAARLAELEGVYGRYETDQWSIRFDGAEAQPKIAALMDHLRACLPTELAGIAVSGVRDLAGEQPPADVVALKLGDAGRITVRPSGTEPKCKVYFEIVRRPGLELAPMAEFRSAMADVLGV